MLWIPGLLVLLLAVFMTFFEQYFLPIPTPRVGQPCPRSIRAPYDFVFDEEAAIRKAVDQQLEEYTPIYRFDEDKTREILARWDEFFNALETCRQLTTQSRKKAYACLRQQLPPDTDRKVLSEILRYPHMDKVKELLGSSVRYLLETGILSDTGVWGNRPNLRIRRSGNPQPVKKAASEVNRLSDARNMLSDRLDLLDLSPSLRKALSESLSGLLEPNLTYADENTLLLEQIRSQRSEKKRILYRRGDLLVPRGKVVTLLDLYRVQDCQAKSPPDALLSGAGSFLPFFLLTLVFLVVARRFGRDDLPSGPPYLLVFFVTLSVLLVAKALYLFTNLDGVAMPLAASGVTVALLVGLPAALWTLLLTAIYGVFLTTLDMGLFLYYLIGGLVFVLLAAKTSKRISLLFCSLLAGMVNLVLVFSLILMRESFPNQALMIHLAPQAFLGAPGAWLVAVLITPLSERLFGLATSERLRELADLNHPLLKRLQEKAPGTYYHSLGVANLACVAAEAVGADVHLVRAGAYYHDIGKIMQPEFFIENQNNRENPHDSLDPASSCEIVKAHVKDGIQIARQYRFPQAVIDLIAEHHGTTVLEAFFSKAQQKQPEMDCSPDFFRYEGPKPCRVESGILMIADVVEAMGRLLTTTNPQEIRETVHRVVVKKFEDGQFDRCGFSTRTLAQMETALAHTLLRVLHKRIDYPGGETARKDQAGAEAP